jgi:hypothetical protein
MKNDTTIQEFIENSPTTKIAFSSFIIGTLLFVLYITTKEEGLLLLGFLYTLIAVVVNLIVFFFLCYNLIVNFQNCKQIILEMGIVIANIPIVILYISLVINNPFN